MKHFVETVAMYLGLQVYFLYFNHTITEILRIFKTITYLWHTWEATTISNNNMEQPMQKLGIAHSCYEILPSRLIFPWAGHF